MKVIFVFLLLVAVYVTAGGWVVMLVAGMLHHDVLPQLPPWSLVQSIEIALALRVIGQFFQSSGPGK